MASVIYTLLPASAVPLHDAISQALGPTFGAWGLAKLTDHWAVLVLSLLACIAIFALSEACSPVLFPNTFKGLTGFQKINWHIHSVSFVHSVLSLYLNYQLINDPTLTHDPVRGFSTRFGDVTAVSAGYFLWDAYVCIKYIRQTGPGFAIHGVIAFIACILSYAPFIAMYGPMFMMVELSTPFLNIHWFMDKIGLTGSLAQLVNGIILLGTFFYARILYCPYSVSRLYLDLYRHWGRFNPMLGYIYIAQSATLTVLNVYWFSKMITALRSRFAPEAKVKKVE